MSTDFLRTLLVCSLSTVAVNCDWEESSTQQTKRWPILQSPAPVQRQHENSVSGANFDGILPGTQRLPQTFSGFLSGGHTASGFDLETFTKNAAVEANRKKTVDMASVLENRVRGSDLPLTFFGESATQLSKPPRTSDSAHGVRVLPFASTRTFDFAAPDEPWQTPYPPFLSLPRFSFFDGTGNGIRVNGDTFRALPPAVAAQESRFGFNFPKDILLPFPSGGHHFERNFLKPTSSNLLSSEDEFERDLFEEGIGGSRNSVNDPTEILASSRELLSGVPFGFPIGKRPSTKTVGYTTQTSLDALPYDEPRSAARFSRKRLPNEEVFASNSNFEGNDSENSLNANFEHSAKES